MALLIFYVLLALGVSFLCSILEAALLTISPASIEAAKQRGVGWAGRMEALKKDIDRPLSAILTLNTIAHTMGAAGAGAQYANLYQDSSEAVFAGILTLAILVITEIIPKTIGAQFATPLAGFVSWILPGMIRILAPLVWLSQQLTKLISLGRAKPQLQHREELLALAKLGERSGELKQSETKALHNLMNLADTRVRDIMTPRSVVYALPEDTPLVDFPELVADKPFSRIPVYAGSLDEITGFVLRTDGLLEALRSSKGGADLRKVRRPIETALESLGVDLLFERFIKERHHIMIVRDEHGTIIGVVTLEDVLETILGFEIVDEVDKVPDLQAYARQLWRTRAQRMGLKVDDDGVVQVEK